MCAKYRGSYTIWVQSYFSAAHKLRGYRGRCEKMHGHNWRVQAEVTSSKLNNQAMVCDFKDLKQKLHAVLKELDHAYLNKLTFFKRNNPTSEMIAEYIYTKLERRIKDKRLSLKAVAVWETENSCAIFSQNRN